MRRWARGLRGEGGSVTVLAAACLSLVCLLCLLVGDIGQYLEARGRAENAADAAALCAVQESFPLFASGEGPMAAGGRLASLNGARIESMTVSPGGDRVQVEVSVRLNGLLLGKLGIMPGRVAARAAAEVDIDGLLSSGEISYTGDPARLAGLRYALPPLAARDGGAASTTVVLLALQHLGKPYLLGAEGPDRFDCSGLVCYVYAQIGVRLPRVTFSQVRCGRPVSTAELRAGDLVFFRGNGHVGIYIGGGSFVHAPHTGDVVKISPLSGRSPSACRRIL